jgi:DNA-binding transcriptional LysR family regulator
MNDLHERLPRLPGLAMFEAAARHMSFTLAAKELHVTQAAVSQQVRALEKEVGTPLFVRRHRTLALTREGDRLNRAVSMGLEHIANTVDEIRGVTVNPSIAIGVTFAVATFWLVSRLEKFRALHPNVSVHVVASDRGFDKIADQVDVGIAFGLGQWDGFTSTLLQRADVFPVCSPKYLRRNPQLRDPEQLSHSTLLSIDDNRPGLMDWPVWLSGRGVKTCGPIQRTVKFNSHPLLLQAACEGQGVALGWSLLVDDLLASGKLVRPFQETLQTNKGYYLLVRDSRSTLEVRAFCDWLTGHFKSPASGASPRKTKIAASRKDLPAEPNGTAIRA